MAKVIKMELTEKEAHCVARLLQSATNSDNILNGCTFCKYQCRTDKKIAPRYQEILQKFQKETGVDLSDDSFGFLPYSNFPYKKFLINANDAVIEGFKNYFTGKG